MINIFMYYYDDYVYINDYLNLYKSEKLYSNNDYEKYKVRIDKEDIIVFIYNNINILAIMANKNNHMNKLKGISFLKKVNLLEKDIFENIFVYNISNNLCNVSIDIDILGSEEELVEFEGMKLMDLNLLDDFDFFDNESEIKLKSYSIQPLGYKYILKINSVNKLQFNNKYDINDIEDIILKLIFLIKLIKGEEKNI